MIEKRVVLIIKFETINEIGITLYKFNKLTIV